MRHFMFIQSAYKAANVKVNKKELYAMYSLAKIVAKERTAAKFTFKEIDWLVEYYGDSMRMSLITQNIMYSIYDGKGYKNPIIEVNILKK